MPPLTPINELLRELSPQVLGAVLRRYHDFASAEDAVQEALIAAAERWPLTGMPDNPRGWLIQVAARRMTDQRRSEIARRKREQHVEALVPTDEQLAQPPDSEPERDDTLLLLFMSCHPALSQTSSIALTLRAVGGLSTLEIARAFMVPEATMAQRISRAKQNIKASSEPLGLPEGQLQRERLPAVLHVLYLIFNEGYTSSHGPDLQRIELASEAIRLTRAVHALLPENGEAAGLLALMLLTHARRKARTSPEGDLIPLTEQDRSLWDQDAIREGVALVSETLTRGSIGAYQVQAAIQAVHDEAASPADTDWPQILALYGVLARMGDNPVVTLNRAVALAMVHGPRAGLELLDTLDEDARLAGNHRVHAARAHLLEMAGEPAAAMESFREAAKRTTSLPEQRYLINQAARLAVQLRGG